MYIVYDILQDKSVKFNSFELKYTVKYKRHRWADFKVVL